VMVAVNTDYPVAIGRAEMLEVAVFEGMCDAEAIIIRSRMSVPMIVSHVRSFIYMTALVALYFTVGGWFLTWFRRRGDVARVGTRSRAVLNMVRLRLAAVLGKCCQRCRQSQCNN